MAYISTLDLGGKRNRKKKKTVYQGTNQRVYGGTEIWGMERNMGLVWGILMGGKVQNLVTNFKRERRGGKRKGERTSIIG